MIDQSLISKGESSKPGLCDERCLASRIVVVVETDKNSRTGHGDSFDGGTSQWRLVGTTDSPPAPQHPGPTRRVSPPRGSTPPALATAQYTVDLATLNGAANSAVMCRPSPVEADDDVASVGQQACEPVKLRNNHGVPLPAGSQRLTQAWVSVSEAVVDVYALTLDPDLDQGVPLGSAVSLFGRSTGVSRPPRSPRHPVRAAAGARRAGSQPAKDPPAGRDSACGRVLKRPGSAGDRVQATSGAEVTSVRSR